MLKPILETTPSSMEIFIIQDNLTLQKYLASESMWKLYGSSTLQNWCFFAGQDFWFALFDAPYIKYFIFAMSLLTLICLVPMYIFIFMHIQDKGFRYNIKVFFKSLFLTVHCFQNCFDLWWKYRLFLCLLFSLCSLYIRCDEDF